MAQIKVFLSQVARIFSWPQGMCLVWLLVGPTLQASYDIMSFALYNKLLTTFTLLHVDVCNYIIDVGL